ncbi:cell wall hydrolase [Priestia abyssalis]|uniref:cell wall hydrolase n=1 Tax=Priestia abyssalis TaxID=1221450 RepID=UPI001F26362C|nr:cell wall hydrolase [Priestia abyssalis]
MKNTHMKTFIAAFAAAFAFIGVQTGHAEIGTEYPFIKEDIVWKLGQPSGATINPLQEENSLVNDWTYIKAMSLIPDKTNILAVQLSKPAFEIPHQTTAVVTQSLKPVLEIPHKTASVVAATQRSKPVIEAPQTKVLGVQASKPVAETTEKEPIEPAISISAEEKDLFARLVEAEAKGESYEGKTAVATVVLNRVDSSEFPDTITGVIKQVVGKSYAFSPVQNGEINKPASDEAKRAVEEALTRKDRLNNCIYFYNPDIATDDWIRSREVVKTIGNHVFAK